MKIILATILIFLISFNANAKNHPYPMPLHPDEKNLTIDINGEKRSYAEIHKIFYEWKETAKDTEIIYIKKLTPGCKTREGMIKTYPYFMARGHDFSRSDRRKVAEFGCGLSPRDLYGTIVGEKEGSQIIQILYDRPVRLSHGSSDTDKVTVTYKANLATTYIDRNMLMTLTDAKKTIQ